MAKQTAAQRKEQRDSDAFVAGIAHAMRDMHEKYTGPTANIRYGNELAQRCIDYIKSHTAPQNHARLILSEAKRIESVKADSSDYAEQLTQAAFAMRLMSSVAQGE